MNNKHIFLVYDLSVHEGEVHHRLAGKFHLDDDGDFELLENHSLPEDLVNASPSVGAGIIGRLADSQYSRIICLDDLLQGKYPDLIADAKADLEGLPPEQQEQLKHAEYEYHRVGQPVAQKLVVDSNGGAFLDGHALEPAELERIKQHVLSKKAVLRTPSPALVKSEGGWAPDPDLGFDHELPKFMNSRSHRHWQVTNPNGTHIYINGHATGDIAEKYGDLTANKAVKALGNAISGSADESLGKDAKLFRLRGDQFVVHVPTSEHAMVFARNLRNRLEKIPALNGTHRLSVAMGTGNNHVTAHAAHVTARHERNVKGGNRAGQGPTHIRLT